MIESAAPIRLLIHGASGRMGRALLRLAVEDAQFSRRFRPVAAVVGRDPEAVGGLGVPVIHVARLDSTPEFDLAVDFSVPAGFDAVLSLCLERRSALVSGTTGLSEAQFDAIEAAGQKIPILWAANFSLGVLVATELARRAAALLAAWDCDIVEAHHSGKRDAPSGTALALGAAVAAGSGRPPHYASLRAGDIVGEHTVQFAGIGERLEIVHRASDRDIFARGALLAASRLHGRPAKRYALSELMGV
ncbi:MAG TPA: 4-hydroxy-tetrahydrodipicolinate reductase [Xanthomonadales bacterium]|nr:4-hydroxy-tetrahydrodipicolinate reductase [Xanthomonadales bacterium]